ncbi:hypothetical protein QLX67_04700 [Balneolaceae bacterium ANBcel3]|nr:hypothetical protein [Balneolaceae bacterium ANBcel3]
MECTTCSLQIDNVNARFCPHCGTERQMEELPPLKRKAKTAPLIIAAVLFCIVVNLLGFFSLFLVVNSLGGLNISAWYFPMYHQLYDIIYYLNRFVLSLVPFLLILSVSKRGMRTLVLLAAVLNLLLNLYGAFFLLKNI